MGQEEENDFVAGMLGDENEGSFEFVVIPGVGYEANYTGYDVRGKIAVVRRGGNSFEQKVAIAQDMGAVGVIIYNNVSGMLNMSVGTRDYIPSCLISMDYGNPARGAGHPGPSAFPRITLQGPSCPTSRRGAFCPT